MTTRCGPCCDRCGAPVSPYVSAHTMGSPVELCPPCSPHWEEVTMDENGCFEWPAHWAAAKKLRP